MDKKVLSNEHVNVWVLPKASVKDINCITVEEMNSAVAIGDAINWDDTTIPAAKASKEQSSLSLLDAAGSSSRGAAQYEGSLTMYYPTNPDDVNSIYAKAWNMFKKTRVDLVLVVRGVLKGRDPIAAGQWYCAFLMIESTYKNTLEGDNPTRYTVSFLQQGQLAVNGIFKDSTTAITDTEALTVSLNEHRPILPKIHGHQARSVCFYLSKDTSTVTVSPLGVVTGLKTGSTDVIVSHPACANVTVKVTVA